MDWYQDVLDFHRKFGCATGATPALVSDPTLWLRDGLVDEERHELFSAMMTSNLPAIADACADLIYVVLGTAIAYGIDLRPVWDAVHEANMAKVGGGKRADGKVQKPEGWQAPDVAGILAKQEALK